MSYQTWTTEGYGICTDDIECNTSAERVKDLLLCAPEYRKEAMEEMKKHNVDMEDEDEIIDCLADNEHLCGLADVMQRVISEAENISLESCDDRNGSNYLLLKPRYPWSNLTDEEKALTTQEKADELFEKYIEILTDLKCILIDYRSVEQCG